MVADQIFRTYKFLTALAVGLPIVTPEWTSKLPRSRNEMAEFGLKDAAGEKRYNFKLEQCLKAARDRGPIFRDKQVFASPSVKPSPEEIEIIVRTSGGKFETDLAKADSANLSRIVVVATKEDKQFVAAVKAISPKILIITAEGFMRSILHCKLYTSKELRI